MNQWYDHPALTTSVERELTGGLHSFVVEYYDKSGEAVARFSWERISATSPEWQGEYFNNTTLGGTPALARTDSDINFDWRGGSPAPGSVDPDQFSVRWKRIVELPAGNYRFSMTIDDGGRLWVNDTLLIDAWFDQGATTYSGDINILGGPVPLQMEYYENRGWASARLSWDKVPPASGVVIVDDTDLSFVRGGEPESWNAESTGYANRHYWSWNSDANRPSYHWARWYPNLAPGRYEVLVYIPNQLDVSSNARYWIAHAHGYTLRTIDQAANPGRWVPVGTYWFDGGGEEYVSLADLTLEPRLSSRVAFDGVKWVKYPAYNEWRQIPQ
jgi:hypothetical protein